MDSDTAVRAENLSKMYRIGELQSGYRTVKEAVAEQIRRPFVRTWNLLRGKPYGGAHLEEEIWPLKDVNFEVKQGEVLGIVGPNGAGKSTLLRVLARITGPTEGLVEIRGRAAALLEVGTGMHPELTGRENIYLTGSILGMKKNEIKSKFDEIVEFSGVAKFIDTPLKHYSSGMCVRLGFSVAAQLEPEVLLVDEVLAVGDAQFRKQSVRKMEDVSLKGRTVLFVSHNMRSVVQLCERVILFQDGRITREGSTHDVISYYLQSGVPIVSEKIWDDLDTAPGDEVVRLQSVRVRDESGATAEEFDIRKPIGVDIEYAVLHPGLPLTPRLYILNEEGLIIFVSGNEHDPVWKDRRKEPGLYKSTCWVPGNFLGDGIYNVGVSVYVSDPAKFHFFEPEVASFHVMEANERDTARGSFRGDIPGMIRPLLGWNTEFWPMTDADLKGLNSQQEA